jgi:hypothetical protein
VNVTKGIQLKNESTIKTILYSGDCMLVTKSEELQIAVHQLNNIAILAMKSEDRKQ